MQCTIHVLEWRKEKSTGSVEVCYLVEVGHVCQGKGGPAMGTTKINWIAGACGAECSLFDIFVDTVAQLVGRSAKDIRADLLAQHDRGLSPSPECCDKGIMADNHADCIPFCSPSSSFMTTRGRCGYKYA
eukprot:1140433-Pelagomonas_calceolata.AAC.3